MGKKTSKKVHNKTELIPGLRFEGEGEGVKVGERERERERNDNLRFNDD